MVNQSIRRRPRLWVVVYVLSMCCLALFGPMVRSIIISISIIGVCAALLLINNRASNHAKVPNFLTDIYAMVVSGFLLFGVISMVPPIIDFLFENVLKLNR